MQESSATKVSVPVIVVGNITVGGTGKTPLLIALARHFQSRGLKPGIISRGYGGDAVTYPLDVDGDTAVNQCGDEPLLIAESTDCPVVVDPDRSRALSHLLETHDVDVVLSDDGLQHYRLARDVEIAVIDGSRLFGNGWCLPAGPLREPVRRLSEVDEIVINGEMALTVSSLDAAHSMTLTPTFLVNMLSGEKRPFSGAPFKMGNTVQAVAALGNPERFFRSLENLPYPMERFSFPDHHQYQAADFESENFDPNQPVVMTEKDAIKCRNFAQANFWVLKVKVEVPEALLKSLDGKLESIIRE